MKRFTRLDFSFELLTDKQVDILVNVANKKMNSLLENGREVYGRVDGNGFRGSHPYMTGPIKGDTHKGLLILIEKLPEKGEE